MFTFKERKTPLCEPVSRAARQAAPSAAGPACPPPHFPAPGRALGLDAARPAPAAFLASPWAPRPADRASARLPRQAFPGRRPGSGEGELPPHPALPQTGVRAASSRGADVRPRGSQRRRLGPLGPVWPCLVPHWGRASSRCRRFRPGLIRKIPPRSERRPRDAAKGRGPEGATGIHSSGVSRHPALFSEGTMRGQPPRPTHSEPAAGRRPVSPAGPGAAPALAPVSLLPSPPWPPTLGAEWGALGWWRAFPPVWHTQLHL